MSDAPVLIAHGHADIGITVSLKWERALLEWIPVNNHWCAVRPEDSACQQQAAETPMPVRHVPIDCSSPAVEDQFYQGLYKSLQSIRSTEVRFVAGHFSVQADCCGDIRKNNRSALAHPNDRTDNGGQPIRAFSDHRLLLANRNFCQLIWYCPPSSWHWTQVNKTAIAHPWHRLTQYCHSICSTTVRLRSSLDSFW